ncbi:40S ribosomal protein S11 [Cocos nucifera]|uniref:40S ribosomal protein S11 n=1 Tax=Cocos nucifera TaxID=13894 RepID=A0A8K0N8W8_COCNU|nr:40S ribosomal protein S11 [Cocos nucifera]
MAEQTEKAFLKQPKVFLCSKKAAKGKKPGKGGNRFWKSIGLGFKTPREAIEASRRRLRRERSLVRGGTDFGRALDLDSRLPEKPLKKWKDMVVILFGIMEDVSICKDNVALNETVYEKRHSNIAAHVSPCFRVKEGDHVIIGQCRPLAKTVRFNVLKVIPAGSKSGGGKKAFAAI